MRGRRLVVVALLLAVPACGRLGFGDRGDGGASEAGDGGADTTLDAQVTGALGFRWLVSLDNGGSDMFVAGDHGEVVVSANGNVGTSLSISSTDGPHIVMPDAMYDSVAVHLDGAGVFAGATLLDASGACNPAGVTAFGSNAYFVQSAYGTSTSTACDVANANQEPVIVSVDTAGTATNVATFVATGSAAYGWTVAAYDDGSLGIAGLASQGVDIGSNVFPYPGRPLSFFTRIDAHGNVMWANEVVILYGTENTLAVDGADACVDGVFQGNGSVFGTPVASAGMNDVWVGRLGSDGTPAFIRTFGSTGNEDMFIPSIVGDGASGCWVTFDTPGMTLDGIVLPSGTVFAHLDGTGHVVTAVTTPVDVVPVRAGGRIFLIARVVTPFTADGTTYTPQDSDVVLLQVADDGTFHIVLTVRGASSHYVIGAAAIADDAIAILLGAGGDTIVGTLEGTYSSSAALAIVVGIGPP